MKRAALTPTQRAYFLAGAAFFLLGVGLGLYLLFTGIRERDGLALVIAGALLYFFTPCALGYGGFSHLPPFGVDEEALWIGERRIPLEAIRAAWVEPWGPCALARRNAPTPFLVLELVSGETLALPLVPKGWDEVYDALRELGLGLPPWSEVPEIVEALHEHLNTGVALPQGTRLVYRRRALAVLAALATLVATGLAVAKTPLPQELAGLAGPLAALAYALVVEKRLLLPEAK